VGQFLHMVLGLLFQDHVLRCLNLEEEESERKRQLYLRGRGTIKLTGKSPRACRITESQ
jgi:hypothetical protein